MLTDSQKNRFRARISASIFINENGCWIWQKTKAHNGYGTFAIGGGKNARAHRISFEVHYGNIPDKMDVCHRCDIRDCVNPEHLFIGTRSENILDASRKGRVSRTHHLKGSQHPNSKLTEGDVETILSYLKMGTAKAKLSRQYGVSQRVILLIARGESWKHVPRKAA